jgi:asparagine synthase (glutamine-hydrolysing)
MQPFRYKNILVFLNGEIFNYLELIEKEKNFFPKTRSDVEIIPYLYEKYGIDFLKMLNGMFSIILIDEKRDKLFLIRDRYGEKPLFYLKNKKGLYFASEIRAIKKLTSIEIEKKNIEINFRCGFLPQPLTMYKNLYALEAGHYIEVDKNKITKTKWYNFNLDNDLSNNFNFKTARKKFLKDFDNSLKIRFRSDVKVGLFLSGGLDSNFIFHRLKKLTNKVTLLYCNIPLKIQKEKNKTDVNFKVRESKYNFIKADFNYNYFNKNIIKIINNYDNILFDSSILVFYCLSEIAKKKKN